MRGVKYYKVYYDMKSQWNKPKVLTGREIFHVHMELGQKRDETSRDNVFPFKKSVSFI